MNKNLLALASVALVTSVAAKSEKPNIVLLFADDISARELPIYGSSKWDGVSNIYSSNPEERAKTPVLDNLAKEGVWVKQCWSATVSTPSRAQMMTGRYAHITKWWHNSDHGTYLDEKGDEVEYPIYVSSPLNIGKVAKASGYATYWAGKTQMTYTNEIERYGFDEACHTDGIKGYPYSDFYLKKGDKKGYSVNVDNGDVLKTYEQSSYYWKPFVTVINDPNNKEKVEYWPNTEKEKKSYGLTTYGPDVETDHTLNFIERTVKSGDKKPFFIYHTAHLGHGAVNFIDPKNPSQYPQTPKIEYRNGKYYRTEPKITGDNGVYDFHGTLTGVGIHNHVSYLDYVTWRYMEKFKELGIEKNTIFVFCADNATSKYGKASVVSQKGVHVPMIIYAPGMKFKKSGEQDILMNLADVMPTLADAMGYEFPADYELNGRSLLPYLTTSQSDFRDWVYSYRSEKQLYRGRLVLKDGGNKWYDVSGDPDDLISYPEIKDWSKVSAEHRAERDMLKEVTAPFNTYFEAHNGFDGGFTPPANSSKQEIRDAHAAYNRAQLKAKKMKK